MALLPVTLALTACPRPGHLGDECTRAPARAEWTSTATAGRIDGVVTDDEARVPVGNVAMRLDDSVRTARTDADGRFHFDSVAEGRHLLANESSVYQRHVDTLVLTPARGLHGAIALHTGHDVLSHCWIYRP